MRKLKINKALIDSLRLNTATTKWVLDSTKQSQIVPDNLTHEYLLRNFNIDNIVLEYYFLHTASLLSENEFKQKKTNGFIGTKARTLYPYSNIIYGAYYSRSDLLFKLGGIIYSNEDYLINGNTVGYLSDLIPYFKEYAKGFEDGFNEFDNSQINPFFTRLAEKQDYVNKVFEFVTKQIFFSHSWINHAQGFSINQKNEIVAAFNDGQIQGYYYKAWSIIFSSHQLFTPLFREHLKQSEPKTDKLKVPQIALIHVYEGKQITEGNAKEIAAKYGYIAKNSGKGLYDDYLKYCKTSDRKAKPTAETKKTLINKIELFKSILIHLSDSAKQKANDEIKILNTILEKEYQ